MKPLSSMKCFQMYSSSTQKKFWTFSLEELREMRRMANEGYKRKMNPSEETEPDFLNVNDETDLLKIVTETGIRFGEEFTPQMWPAVKWTAFAYFKRFYLRHTPMEFAPKNIIVACELWHVWFIILSFVRLLSCHED